MTPAPSSDSLSLRLPLPALTSPPPVTRRLIMQKARHSSSPPRRKALTACKHTVSGALSLPVTGVLFTFPSRYLSSIGGVDVFSLGRWASLLPTSLPVARGTRAQQPTLTGASGYGTLTLSGPPFQVASPPHRCASGPSCQPPLLPLNPTPAPDTNSSTGIVWTLPLSLATTPGIALAFSSSGY